MLRRPPTRLQLKTDDIEEYEEVCHTGLKNFQFIFM